MYPDRDPLNLSTLPLAEPPADRWAQISHRLERQRRPGLGRWLPAVAAVFAAALGLATILRLNQQVEAGEQALEQWIGYSQALESELRTLQTAAYAGHQAMAVSELEDMVAVVDSELAGATDPQRRLRLWQQRATLLSDLVNIHAMARGQRLQAGNQPLPVVTRTTPSTLAAYEQ